MGRSGFGRQKNLRNLRILNTGRTVIFNCSYYFGGGGAEGEGIVFVNNAVTAAPY